MPKTTTTRLYLLTGLLLPTWRDIPTTNERIYRVTPDEATAMIGRTLSQEGAAALCACFLVSNPQSPVEMLTAALTAASIFVTLAEAIIDSLARAPAAMIFPNQNHHLGVSDGRLNGSGTPEIFAVFKSPLTAFSIC